MTSSNSLDLQDIKVELPFGAPPILPDVKRQLEEYIINPDNLPIHNYELSQQHWKRKPNPHVLYNVELSKPKTTLKVGRDPTTGVLTDFSEVMVNGEDMASRERIKVESIIELLNDVNDKDIGLGAELLEVAPWFTRGFNLTENKGYTEIGSDQVLDTKEIEDEEESHIVNLASVVKDEQELLKLWIASSEEEKVKTGAELIKLPTFEDEIVNAISTEVKFSAPVITLSHVQPFKGITSTEWAEVLDVSQPVSDFHDRIPDMAFKFEFELDTFQKQAILKLEEHCNVLVAAHTSAGKTVVAEYAIALSQRHMTRTIYTSPIKALSNQKYRDFKMTFKDIGLITGDFQINSTGMCLIMTTEILRSMLLAQNDVIRDLEYVIFDEVHYINDTDRGHVWEEVIILLPQHVSIVMLSATVPNALQFADWVGRTKQRRMYVISTLQRPVPLEHFLYTGSGGGSKDERFLILNAKNEFQKKGYNDALEAKKKREAKYKEGAKNRNLMSRKQEMTMWVALLDHLQKHDKLPVVAFTLSRKRCDLNAESLLSLDLTTAKEKTHIRHFFQQCIQKLKKEDQLLPQIVKMSQLLEIGIGVHHSGILPLLKEIVELLFQEKCVKVLFATETFAMGVNMPAKTVVFDSIKKFDGVEPRILLPSEYIQMAGRAGRRGLDATGTVIIICKGDVPSELDLTTMMKGMPRRIESQFRLTYSIILKLERKRVAAEGRVTVEEMMAHSFKEADHIKKKKRHTEHLARVENDLQEVEQTLKKDSAEWEQLSEVCAEALDYLAMWHDMSSKVYADKPALKVLTPGRVVLVTHKHHVMKLGVLLSYEHKKEIRMRVMVLCDREDDEHTKDDSGVEDKSMKEDWFKVLSLTQQVLFVPDAVGPHTVLTVDPCDVMEVTSITVKLDPKIVLGDWDNRQIPRFRDNPPGQSFKKVLEELTEITHNANMSKSPLEYLNLFKDMKISSEEELRQAGQLARIKTKIHNTPKDNLIDLASRLRAVFQVKYLENKRQNLKYLLSYQSMSLYADYQNKLDVLRKLKYVDNKNSVQLKGNVACEMSNHELLITELVLKNALNDLQPAEIAALLSCFVYQGKKEEQPLDLTASLQQGVETIKTVAKEVFQAEKRFGVSQSDASGNEEQLNFDLVPVVYEWARDKPFSEIMMLTEIQEGIIVRCIQQLNETIRDVRDAARIIGEPTLQQKMEDASNAIKRDIVFAGSLYMQ